MTALNRKLLRDIGHIKGQVISIALVVACGIASYISLQSAWVSLAHSREAFYRDYRFGDVFVHVKRAPASAAYRMEALDGVAEVYPRIVEWVTIPMLGGSVPPTAEVVSLPGGEMPPLGRLYLTSGRLATGTRETVLLSRFAERHRLHAGDSIPVIMNGSRRWLMIVGLATSPEYVYPLPQGGAIAVDDDRFAVLWMDRKAMAAAFRMEGAFNDAVIRMTPAASTTMVREEIDRILEPYGTVGAVGRDRQSSNLILREEMSQLRTWATVVPLLFLGVSAFLVNVVLARLVELQRPEVATLKAIGYSDWSIGLHYLELAGLIVLIGAAIGIGLGGWLGSLLTGVYADVFRFPTFSYRLEPGTALVAVSLSLGAAATGAMLTVRRIVALPPAEALRPPAPARFRPLLAERLGIERLLPSSVRMILRELERRPLRLALSVIGIATAMALLIVGRFTGDAFDYLIDLQFSRVMREDLTISFREPVPLRAIRTLQQLPGVRRAEGVRAVPIRIESGHRFRDVALIGLSDEAELRQVLSRASGAAVSLPVDGVMLTATLAELLAVRPGDSVHVLVREGDRRAIWLPVVRLVDELTGIQGYLRLDGLSRVLGEAPAVSMGLLSVQPDSLEAVVRKLNQYPVVMGIISRSTIVRRLREQSGRSMAVISLVLTLFAATIAAGVVYNNARATLSLRGRDLASLRVLGFTSGEVSRILIGELAVQVFLALPAGILLGRWFTAVVVRSTHAERFRLPVVISDRSLLIAGFIIVGTALATSLVVRRRIDRLDLIGVLKTRE